MIAFLQALRLAHNQMQVVCIEYYHAIEQHLQLIADSYTSAQNFYKNVSALRLTKLFLI